MPDGFTPSEEDVAELRRRRAERLGRESDLTDQRNAVLETDSPDDAAYDLKKSRELGIPREAIGGARDQYRNDDVLAQMEKLRTKAPKTSAWLAEPENYAIARDETDKLSAVEDILLGMMEYKNLAGRGIASAPRALLNNLELYGMRIAENPRASLLNAPNPVPFVDMGAAGDAILDGRVKVRGGAEIADFGERAAGAFRNPFAGKKAKVKVPQLPGREIDPIASQLTSAFARAHERRKLEVMAEKAKIEQDRPQTVSRTGGLLVGAERSLAEMLPYMALGFVTRNPEVAMSGMEANVAGESYGRYSLDPSLTKDQKYVLSGIMGKAERIGESFVLKQLFGKGASGDFTKRFLTSMLMENVQEQATTLIQDFAEWQVLNPEKSAEDWMGERGDRAFDTFVITTLASGPVNASIIGADRALTSLRKDADEAEVTPGESAIGALLDSVATPKLRTRSPEKMAELIGKQMEGTEAETIAIDLDGLAQSLEAAGLDITETLTELGVPPDAISETALVMGTVEVPTARLLASEGAQAHRDKIQPHLRLVGEALTPAQKEVVGAEAAKQAARISEDLKADVESVADLASQITEVEDKITQLIRQDGYNPKPGELRASAKVQALMVAHAAKRRAAERGEPIDVRGFFEEIGPRFLGQESAPETDEALLRQARDAGYTGTDTGEARQWTEAVAKGLDMSTEGRMARAKEAGFDVDTTFYHGTQKNFDTFEVGRDGTTGPGVYLTTDARIADNYTRGQGPIMQLHVRGKLAGRDLWEAAHGSGVSSEARRAEATRKLQSQGYDGVRVSNNEVVIFDPSNIRSVNAAFDPDASASSDLLAQSAIRSARMPIEDVTQWVRDNISANIQTFQNGDESHVITFPLTQEEGAPPVMVSIRLSPKGRADVNLFLDNQMADALDSVEDVNERSRLGLLMFSKSIMVMRQFAHENDVKVFAFTAAESQAEGTKPKSREKLYRFMLSSIGMDGYTAYEVTSQTAVVRETEPGTKEADPLFAGSGFMLVKDGVDADEYARNEILRGRQTGGSAGEVVTALRAVRLGRGPRGTDGRVDAGRPRTGEADPSGDLNQLLASPEVQQALSDPDTDVLPLTGEMEVMELDQFLAYHGTRQKFDKFETSKGGSGEGAQAFGPGHYFTQSKGIAEWYRKRMKQLAPGIRIGDEAFNKANPVHFALAKYWQWRDPRLSSELFGTYHSSTVTSYTHKTSLDMTIRMLTYDRDNLWRDWVSVQYSTPSARNAALRDQEEITAFINEAIAYLRSLDPDSSRGIPKPSKKALAGGGNIYTVAVKLPAEATIQFDKTLGEQSPQVQAALRAASEAGALGEASGLIAQYGDETKVALLVKALGGIKSPAMAVMREHGVRGVRYLAGASRGKRDQGDSTFNYVVFNDEDVQILDRTGKLFQSLDQEKRGGYSPATRQISFTEARDVSTLMHEGAHWYLDMLEKLAPSEAWAAEDLRVIEGWYYGIRNSDTMKAIRARYSVEEGPGGFQITYQGQALERPHATREEAEARIEWRERQEAFAETFEQYLMTGKAPVPSLAKVLRDFKEWLMAVYSHLTGNERANLNPDIRDYFDRVLSVATEVDAASVETFRDAETMAKDMLEKGIITERQYRLVGERLNAAREEVKEELTARVLSEKLRESEDWWAKERAKIKGDLARVFDKSPVGRAYNWLAYGEWKGDLPEGVPAESAEVLFQFAGIKAKGADTRSKQIAERMRISGVDPKVIWQQTGWRLDIDGNWKWEIDDSGAGFKIDPAKLKAGAKGHLWRLFDHPTLFKHYPALAAIDVEITDQLPDDVFGSYNAALMRMQLNAKFVANEPVESLRRMVSHEIQHAIQSLEGFSMGANPDIVSPFYFAAEVVAKEALRNKVASQINLAMAEGRFAMAQDGRDELARLEADIERTARMAAYNRVSGEAEARMTETRMGLSAEERRGLYPQPDVPVDEMTIRMYGQSPKAPLTAAQWGVRLEGLTEQGGELDQGSRTFNPPGHGAVPPPADLPPIRLDLRIIREQYGEDAVKKLPAAVRRRSSTSSNVTEIMATIETVRKTLSKRRKGPQTLTQFLLAKKRTLQDGTKEDTQWGIKGAAEDLKAMGLEKLINEKSGRTLDYAREAAEEAGFIGPRADDVNLTREAGDLDATPSDLLDALARDARGEAVVRPEDEGANKDQEDARVWANWLDQNGVDIYETDKKKLRASVEAMLSATDEALVSPDRAAEMLGFKTGEELLEALSAVGNRDKHLNKQADAEMANEYGDMVNDGTLQAEAREAARLDIAFRQTEIEMEALARAVGVQASSNYAKQLARDIIGVRTVKEIAAYERDLDAERRFGKAALRAVEKGDYAEALKAKQRQLIAMHLYREGKKAHEKIEKTREHLLTYEKSEYKRRLLGKAGETYLQQMDDLLSRYRLRKEGPKAIQSAESLHAWATKELVGMDPLKHLTPFKGDEQADSEASEADPLAGLEEIGRDEQLQAEEDIAKARALERMAEESAGTSYKRLTFEEFMSVRDQADMIYGLAKAKTMLLADASKMELRAAVSQIVESIIENKTRDARPDPLESDLPAEVRRRQFRDYMDAHRTLLSLFRQMDGGKDGGPLQMLLSAPLSKAFGDRAAVWREMEEGLAELFSVYEGAERGGLFTKKVHVPGVDVTMTKQGILAVALNMGTAKNRQRMMDSEGWSEADLYAIVDSLDQRDWQFVQNVWKYLGSWFPKANEVHTRVHGLPMDKVEATPVVTKYGTISGGYYPIVFDPVRSSKTAQRQLTKEANAAAGRVGARSQAGFTKKRAEGKVQIPIRYSVLDVIIGHLGDVADSITLQEPLMDVGRIVVHPDFEAAVKQKYGGGVYRQILLAMREAKQGQEVARGATEKALVHLRNGQTVVGLGWRFSTAALQVFGLTNSSARIGTYWVMKGVARTGSTALSKQRASDFATGRSSMMANRKNSQQREIADLRNKFKGEKAPGWVKESFFWMITATQFHVVDVPTWIGQYEKSIAAGHTEEDAATHADLAVQEAQGTGEIYGLAGIQRGSPLLKLFTNFLSFMVTTLNLATQKTGNTNFRSPKQVAGWSMDMAALLIWPVLTKMLLDAALKGKGPDDDDDETWLGLYAKEQASFLMSMNFFPAQVTGMVSGYVFDGPTGTAALKDIEAAGTQVIEGVTEEDQSVMDAYRPALRAAGAIFHIPTGQIDTSIQGLRGLMAGESEDYSDLLFGPDEETRTAMRGR